MRLAIAVIFITLAGCDCGHRTYILGSNDSGTETDGGMCSLFAQDCPNGEACVPIFSNVCQPPGNLGPNEACDGDGGNRTFPCTPGYDCVFLGSSGSKCLPFCNLDGGAPSCASGTCAPPGNMPLPDNAGFCF